MEGARGVLKQPLSLWKCELSCAVLSRMDALILINDEKIPNVPAVAEAGLKNRCGGRTTLFLCPLPSSPPLLLPPCLFVPDKCSLATLLVAVGQRGHLSMLQPKRQSRAEAGPACNWKQLCPRVPWAGAGESQALGREACLQFSFLLPLWNALSR